jgi:amino acid transporter
MGAFGLDALSSVAYGPDQILYVLILAGSAGVALDMPVAFAIAALLGIVAFSYRQTIYAYPHGGGSYTVARENLGTRAGLTAAAALMVDYLTTVAVSVTAGVAAIVAFVPSVNSWRVIVDVVLIALIILINLRGVRDAGAAFVLPTYIFIGSLGLLLVIGGIHILISGAPAPTHNLPPASESLTVFLVLRAFAGGCTAMTGIEAIANGVPAFKDPTSKNAARTLITLAVILAVLFLGVAALGHAIGAIPTERMNVIAQVGDAFAGGSPLFYIVQVSSAIILMLAANTSFNGFPRLAAVMAADSWFPHSLSHRGFRLAYSNGIIGIGVAAIALVVAFDGSTNRLIPLFAVGVFLCFTLSQSGMVVHWRRQRGRNWRRKAAINGTGAVTTAIVTLIVVSTKFTAGAWIVVVLVPFLVLGFYGIHRHYARTMRELKIDHLPPLPRDHPAGGTVVVPVAHLNRAAAEALVYARTITDDVRAVHIASEEDGGAAFERRWREWSRDEIPLQLVASPYREVVSPLLDLITDLTADGTNPVTVVVPTVVPAHFWQAPLHNQLEYVLNFTLQTKPGIEIKAVPVRVGA